MRGHIFLLALFGCTVAQNSQNISDPNNDPNVHIWPQSETIVDEILPTMAHPQGVVGAVYNDFSGYWICDPNFPNTVNCPLIPRQGGTRIGYSYSLDRGGSWTRVGTLPVPACTSTPCITLLDGDPWLVSNGDRMLYSSMAEVTGDAIDAPTAVAVANSADGINWSPFQIAARSRLAGKKIDKPSMSMLTDRVVLAYVDPFDDQGFSDISVATSELPINGQNIVWKSNRLFLPYLINGGGTYQNAITRYRTRLRTTT